MELNVTIKFMDNVEAAYKMISRNLANRGHVIKGIITMGPYIINCLVYQKYNLKTNSVINFLPMQRSQNLGDMVVG